MLSNNENVERRIGTKRLRVNAIVGNPTKIRRASAKTNCSKDQTMKTVPKGSHCVANSRMKRTGGAQTAERAQKMTFCEIKQNKNGSASARMKKLRLTVQRRLRCGLIL